MDVDLILLQGALEVEHHEIGVYENLILSARALGRDDVVEVLQRSYDSDATAAKKVYALEEKLGSRQPV